MKEQTGRARRVAELIREEVAKLLTHGIKDPRVGFVSVMDVRMSPDLRYANIYVSLYGDEKEQKSSIIALRNSSGWLRRELGKHLRIRVTPELRFFPDDTLDQVYKLEEVIHEIQEERKEAPMLRLSLEEVVEELRAANSFLIVAHTNPDGDAVGSILGLRYLLESMGKKSVTCALSDPVPRRYRTLPGALDIVGPDVETIPTFELAIIVDVAQRERIGEMAQWISEGTRVMVLDHHLDEYPQGDAGLVDTTYAAAGELIFDLYETAEVPLSKNAATCLYTAQATDTGGYRYSNTNSRSHRMAAHFHDAGIDNATICQNAFDLMSRAKFDLLRKVLDRTALRLNGQAAWSYLSHEDIDAAGGTREDLEGLVNYPRNIEGVDVAVFFHAVGPEETKISLRSTPKFNSADFCRRFGGGGHAAAAAARIAKPFDVARDDVLSALDEAFGAEKS